METLAWWQVGALADATIAVAYFYIFVLIIVPTSRSGLLRANPLATATAAIFFSCSVGHGLHAIHTVLPLVDGVAATVPMADMAPWWLAGWHGTTALVAVYYVSLRRSFGRLLVSAPMFDDVEQRRAAASLEEARDAAVMSEAGLRRSETVYRSAFEDAMVGMLMVGLDGQVIRANPVFAAMLGRRPEELVGTDYHDLMHHDDVAGADADAASVAAQQIPGYRAVRRFVHADGSTVYVDLSSSLVYDDDGRPMKFSVQTVDVTSQRIAERELEVRDRMLQGIVTNSQSLIHVKDLDGRYILVNSSFARAFNVIADEILGKTGSFLNPELAPIWRLNDLRAQRESYQVEEWSDGPDGRTYYDSMKFPLHDSDGAVYATCGVSSDVTARSLATRRADEALEAALDATRAKSQFLATMSHEIRTPMNAVIGMTGLLLDTELDPQQRGFAEIVRSSGDALLAVINDILDFSKLEANAVELESAPFELHTCLDEALSLVGPAPAGLDVVLNVDARCPVMVRGDMHRLRQVISNLVSNAVKFTPAGEIEITVAPTDRPDGGAGPAQACSLRFTVRDTGIGVPPDRLDRLFTAFTQVDASTTRVYGGTGLGLAICNAIVTAMGGSIDVDSTAGLGSTFAFEVTLGVEPGSAQPSEQGTAPDAAIDLDGRRALIVDDNETNRRVLRLQLETSGMRCVDVESGAAALSLLRAGERFDVAILDMHMPAMDGAELAHEIRAVAANQALPLLLLTSVDALPATKDLFDAFLMKPVRAAHLRTTVAGLLGIGADRSSTAAASAPGTAEQRSQQALRVLLAEDNATNQLVGRLMLSKLGHHVEIAGTGQEALDALERERYDVVLMDVHMPVMDGLDATRAIRARYLEQPRIIAMTASSLDADRRECAAAGMDGYLLKPVQLDDLAAALESQPHLEAV